MASKYFNSKLRKTGFASSCLMGLRAFQFEYSSVLNACIALVNSILCNLVKLISPAKLTHTVTLCISN